MQCQRWFRLVEVHADVCRQSCEMCSHTSKRIEVHHYMQTVNSGLALALTRQDAAHFAAYKSHIEFCYDMPMAVSWLRRLQSTHLPALLSSLHWTAAFFVPATTPTGAGSVSCGLLRTHMLASCL